MDVEPILSALEIPDYIVNILRNSGFESLSALALLEANSIDEIEKFVNENRLLVVDTIYNNKKEFKFLPGHRALLLNLPRNIEKYQNSNKHSSHPNYEKFPSVLKSLFEAAESNIGKHPNAARYNDIIRYFSTYIYLLCGKACYETLCANLPLPKAGTICKYSLIYPKSVARKYKVIHLLHFFIPVGYIHAKNAKIIEGQLRIKELSEYLDRINAKRYIFLSEDASGIISKVEYDPKSNQLIGLVLPIASGSGMPIVFSFKASSQSEIQRLMELQAKSTLVYIIMAQPLMEHTPPFVLQIFGTDNKFTTINVMDRWICTAQELKR